MTVELKEIYHADIQQKMRNVYRSLSEKDRRRYAAAEVVKLGYGGVASIAELFECSRESIDHGMRELDQLPDDPVGERIRRPGAGRKKVEDGEPQSYIGHRISPIFSGH